MQSKGTLPIDVVLYRIKQSGGVPFRITFCKMDGSGQLKTVNRALYGKKSNADGVVAEKPHAPKSTKSAEDKYRLGSKLPLVDLDAGNAPCTPYISHILFYDGYIVKH